MHRSNVDQRELWQSVFEGHGQDIKKGAILVPQTIDLVELLGSDSTYVANSKLVASAVGWAINRGRQEKIRLRRGESVLRLAL